MEAATEAIVDALSTLENYLLDKKEDEQRFSISLSDSLKPFTTIPKECRSLTIQDLNIRDLMNKKNKFTMKYPNVKDLLIVNGQMHNLTVSCHQKFSSFIKNKFPGLETLDASYELSNPSDWANMKGHFIIFRASVFNGCSQNIRGSIKAKKSLQGNFETAIEDVEGQPDIIVNRETKCIEKTFEIYPGLTFSCSLSFDQPNNNNDQVAGSLGDQSDMNRKRKFQNDTTNFSSDPILSTPPTSSSSFSVEQRDLKKNVLTKPEEDYPAYKKHKYHGQ